MCYISEEYREKLLGLHMIQCPWSSNGVVQESEPICNPTVYSVYLFFSPFFYSNSMIGTFLCVFPFLTGRVKWWRGWEEPWIWWPVLVPRSWSPWSTQPRCALDITKLVCVILYQELAHCLRMCQAWADSVILFPRVDTFASLAPCICCWR